MRTSKHIDMGFALQNAMPALHNSLNKGRAYAQAGNALSHLIDGQLDGH